jgi:two-component system cell cycle sensor histidine kinase/response regulator CckA
VVNARDAMPHGGTLTIETRNVVLDDAHARVHAGVEHGRYVMLAISDTGVGMSHDVLSHLFEPFFTTKGAGEGTGLGLATVYGIVKQSGGHVWADSDVGHGTRFDVHLPRIDQPLEAVIVQPPHTSLRGTETVLLVEDEPAVRMLARRVLEAQGYRVLEAADGVEAVQLAKQQQGPIDLLLTDVIMPHMSGPEVSSAVTAVIPGIRTLYMSGYTANAIAPLGMSDSTVPLVEKPFTPASLASKVREVLGEATH